MNSVLLGNPKLFCSQQHYLLPKCQLFQRSWHLVRLTRERDEYEKPLALSPLTAIPAAVIRFEIEVPRKLICLLVCKTATLQIAH